MNLEDWLFVAGKGLLLKGSVQGMLQTGLSWLVDHGK